MDRADGFDQDWTLDGLGNFSSFNDDGTSQNRTVNEANQIQTISGGWVSPEYDAAGNMIFAPKSGDETTGLHFVRDAWNRLARCKGVGSRFRTSHDYAAFDWPWENEMASIRLPDLCFPG